MAEPQIRPADVPDGMPPGGLRGWAPSLVVIVASLILFGWGVGSYSLNDPWEPRYPQTVREMMERGDPITPYYEGDPRWTKPILIYWSMYVPVWIFGNNEFAARLPSVLAATLGVLAVYFCLARLRGRATGLIAAGILATTPQYFFMARQATPDMLLTASLAAAMGFFAVGRFGSPERKRLFFGLFYASVGLAFLAKGPVACVITLMALFFFWLIDLEPRRLVSPKAIFEDLRRTLTYYHVGLGALIFLVVAGPWYILIWAKHGNLFIDSFFRGENLHRFAEPVKNLQGTASHYVETMFHGMFPWNGLIPVALLGLWFGRSKLDDETRQRWFYMSWFFAIFLLFTISGTKLDHYILPITASMAIIIALIFERYLDRETPFWIRPALLVSLVFSLLPIRDFLLLSNQFIMDAYTNKQEITNVNVELALRVLFGMWVAAVVGAVLFTRFKRVMVTLVVAVAYSSALYFSLYLLPTQEQVRSVKHYVMYVKENGGDNATLMFFGKKRHSVVYYAGGKEGVVYYNRNRADDVARYVTGRSDVFIIAERRYANYLLDKLRKKTGAQWQHTTSGNPNYDLISNTYIRGARF